MVEFKKFIFYKQTNKDESFKPYKYEKFLKDHSKKLILKQRDQYFKQYANLRFDVIRSPNQIEHWNSIIRSKAKNINANFLIPVETQFTEPVVIKLIQHIPRKFYSSEFNTITSPNWKAFNKKIKNAK